MQRLKHYFACSDADAVRNMEACGARNVLFSFYYLGKILRKYSMADLRDMFDSIIIDSGAFSAYTLSDEIPFERYADWVYDNKEYYDYAIQLDSVFDQELTLKNYEKHLFEGTPWVVPVLTGRWDTLLPKLEPYLETDYIGLGGSVYGFADIENALRALPTKYKYHGFAMGLFSFYKQESPLLSVDNSTWTYLSRVGSFEVWDGSDMQVVDWKSKLTERDEDVVYQFISRFPDELETCGITLQDCLDYDRDAIQRMPIIMTYRGYFKTLSNGVFEENFKF